MENLKSSFTSLLLNGEGGIVTSTLPEAAKISFTWIHFDFTQSSSQHWLEHDSQLDHFVCTALSADETRPRVFFTNQGILMVLRAINATPGEAPEDMVSIRVWIEEHRIITASKHEIPAINELVDSLRKNEGPRTPIDLLIDLVDRVLDHVSEVVDSVDESIDQFEEEIIQHLHPEGHKLRIRLSMLRQRIIGLRRYLAPQREALGRTQMITLEWLSQTSKLRLLELADRTIRYLEDLDEGRDRATVIQETISNIISEQVERRMYILSMVAAIFLPLSLIAGLLGMNVGGIPGMQSKEAFSIVVLFVIFLGFMEYFIFKKKQWM